MPYPKPLSEKSLEKMYREAGINEKNRVWLHELYNAAVNLYGALFLRELWNIYIQLVHRGILKKIQKKQFIAFSSIARREEQPYYVYEIDELYTEEPRADLDRVIVNGDLIGKGYGKYRLYYHMMDQLGRQPFYIPDDLLSYAEPKPVREETALLNFLNDLKVTADQCIPPYGDPYPCENKGKRLNEFSFLTKDELFELEYIAKKPEIVKMLEKEFSGTEAEKLIRAHKRSENIGALAFTDNIRFLTQELEEVGVQLTEKELKQLLQLLNDYHNHTHLWCIRGWAPSELHKTSMSDGQPGIPSITFGPGMQKAFADGTLNKNELIAMLREKGIQVIE